MSKSKVEKLVEKVERWKELSHSTAEKSYSPKFGKLSDLSREMGKVGQELEYFKRLREDRGKKFSEKQVRELDALQKKFDALKDEWQALNDEKEASKAEVERLRGELAAFDFTADAETIAEHRLEVEASRKVVADLEAAIERQTEIIGDNPAEDNAHLLDRRKEILAGQAIGGNGKKDFSKELQTVDKEISELENRNAIIAETVENARQAIEGLALKLTVEKDRLTVMESYQNEMVSFLLKAETGQLDREISAKVNETRAMVTRVEALRTILAGLDRSGKGGGYRRAPAVNLSANEEDYQAALVAEKRRLSGLGVQV